MSYLSYAFRNFKSFLTSHGKMFVMMFIFEIIAVICILFSYGLFFNARETSGELTDDQRTFNYYFYASDENDELDFSAAVTDVKSKADKLIEFLGDDYDEITLYLRVTDANGDTHSAAAYGHSDTYTSSVDKIDLTKTGHGCNISSELEGLAQDGYIELDGESFVVGSVGDYTRDVTMSLSSIASGSLCTEMSFMLKSQPTKDKIDEINDFCSETFGFVSVDTPEASKLLDIQINNMFCLYSALIVVILILNLSLYFRFVFQSQKSQAFSFTLCGGTSYQITSIFCSTVVDRNGFEFWTGLSDFQEFRS